MSDRAKAIVMGVGPEAGLGGALCKGLAREGLGPKGIHVALVLAVVEEEGRKCRTRSASSPASVPAPERR